MHIVPGILTNDIKVLKKRIEMAAGLVEWVQIDFIDGIYANNETLGPIEMVDQVIAAQKQGLKIEAHLMVSPGSLDGYLIDCFMVGFDRIIVQIESVGDQDEFVKQPIDSRYGDFLLGLSLDAQTGIEILEDEVLRQLDVVQVMTIKAGFSGQELIPDLLNKVRQLKKIKEEKGYKFLIEVDGGVNLETIKLVKEAGTDLAEVNSGLFKNGNFEDNLKNLKRLLTE